MFAEPALVGVARVRFLKIAAVLEQKLAQFVSRVRADYRSAETVTDKCGNETRMIEMSMREENGINIGRRYRERLAIAQPQLLEALKQAAVDKHLAVVRFDEIFGSGHCADTAQKRKLHCHGRLPHGLRGIIRRMSGTDAHDREYLQLNRSEKLFLPQ